MTEKTQPRSLSIERGTVMNRESKLLLLHMLCQKGKMVILVLYDVPHSGEKREMNPEESCCSIWMRVVREAGGGGVPKLCAG